MSNTPPLRIIWPLHPLVDDPFPKSIQKYPGAEAGEPLKVRKAAPIRNGIHPGHIHAYCPTDDELAAIMLRYPGIAPESPDWHRVKCDFILAGEDAATIERWPAQVVIAKLAKGRENAGAVAAIAELTATAFARVTGMSEATVSRKRKSGEIKALTLENVNRYAQSNDRRKNPPSEESNASVQRKMNKAEKPTRRR